MRKCPYCDFNSHSLDRGAGSPGLPEDRYVNALIADFEHDLHRIQGRMVQSIFIGGGTPSLFSPNEIARLLGAIRARLPLHADAEITMEANPGAVETGNFAGYRAAGVNRLSLGIQSFDPAMLHTLGRIHGREEALRAIDAARRAGFDNLNIDLMYGLPGQDSRAAVEDCHTALAQHPEHLSLYQLTLEPNTLFHAQPPPLPAEDEIAAIQEAIESRVRDAGYVHYEVSAYARPGRECRHNLNYWRFGDYLGIGAGAHAKITGADGITRLWKTKHPDAYMRHAGTPAAIGGEWRLTPDDRAFEFMLNALRLAGGFPDELFTQRTGLPLSAIGAALDAAVEKGLVGRSNGLLYPTPLGQRFLNDLVALFLSDRQAAEDAHAASGHKLAQ